MPTLRQENKSVYWAWKAMKQRCLNTKCKAYKNYGARGIKVVAEWYTFEPFFRWAMNNGYERGLDLDRIDNDGDYSPENCRWITRKKNVNNRRKTIFLTIDGETKPRTEWEEILSIPHGTVKEWVSTRGTKYAENRIRDVKVFGYQEKDYCRNHKMTAIRCVETGEVYPSIRYAAKKLGLASGTLNVAVRKGRTYHGKHYEVLPEA